MIYLVDTAIAESRNDQAGFNKGFASRKGLIQGGKVNNVRIPLYNYSYFQGLETNMLPPSQIQITLQLTNNPNPINN